MLLNRVSLDIKTAVFISQVCTFALKPWPNSVITFLNTPKLGNNSGTFF